MRDLSFIGKSKRLIEILDEKSALTLAMEMEKESYNFFKKYAEKFNDTKGKEIFIKFAAEEQDHYRTIEREYLDSNKIGVSAGGSGIFGAWRIDGAVDFTLPGTRKVPDNTADYTFGTSKWGFANVAPGDYYGYVVTVELAVVRRL